MVGDTGELAVTRWMTWQVIWLPRRCDMAQVGERRYTRAKRMATRWLAGAASPWMAGRWLSSGEVDDGGGAKCGGSNVVS